MYLFTIRMVAVIFNHYHFFHVFLIYQYWSFSSLDFACKVRW